MEATLHRSRARAYGEAVLRWRWPVILLTVLAVASMGYGARFLTFNPDSRAFFWIVW